METNKWTQINNHIPFAAAPLALGAITLCAASALGIVTMTGALAALAAAMGALALAVIALVVLKGCRKPCPPWLTLALLLAMIGLFTAVVAVIYPMPQPTQFISIEAGLLLICAIGAAGLSFVFCQARRPMELPAVKRMCMYGLVLPFLCGMTLSMARNAATLPTGVVLNAAVGLGCLALSFLARAVLPIKMSVEAEDDASTDDAPQSRLRAIDSATFVVIFAIVLPQVGLAICRDIFQSLWFPVIALANGLIMLPLPRARAAHPALFYLKAVGFGYILYFALIFLPFVPIGLIGLLVIAGVLFLTPAIVFVMEIRQLMRDYRALSKRYHKGLLWALLFSGILTLPCLLAVNASIDRANYLFAASAVHESAPADPDLSRLTHTLNRMNAVNASVSRGDYAIVDLMGGGTRLPLIDPLYDAIAFDGLPPGRQTVEQLYTTYYKEQAHAPDLSSWAITRPGFVLDGLSATTRYDEMAGAYRSWVVLDITNIESTGNRQYITSFALDEDAYITDYSLYVFGENKRGLLSEKRAAVAVYNQIVNAKRDPGILFYEDRQTLKLSVFPFAANETRTTAFEVMHAGPLTLTIEGQAVALTGGEEKRAPVDLGEHAACTPNTCRDILPYDGDPYANAARLIHNALVSPNDLDIVRDSLSQHVLAPGTAFIVLETAEQERALKVLQQRVLDGEELPDGEMRLISMSEPGMLIVLAMALILIALAKKRGALKRPAVRKGISRS